MRLRFDLSMLDIYQGGKLRHGPVFDGGRNSDFYTVFAPTALFGFDSGPENYWTPLLTFDLAGIPIVLKCLVDNVPFNLFVPSSNATITANGHRPIGSEV